MENHSSSVTRFLMLGALETLINQAIAHEPRARDRLQRLHGTAVRVRTERPHAVLYLLIYEDGVEVLPDFDGYVHVRIRGTLGAMLQWALSPNAPLPEADQIRILGPEDRIAVLATTVSEFSLWSIVRNWLDDHVRLNDLLAVLRREDPQWLGRLQGLPQQVDALATEVAHQRLLQEEVLAELLLLKQEMRRARRLDAAGIITGLLLLLAALGTLTSVLPVAAAISATTQAMLLASAGFTLLVSRLLWH